MATFTVHYPDADSVVIDAADWVTESGLVIFQDIIGRSVQAVVITDGMRLEADWGDDDDLMAARRRLAEVQRASNIQAIEDEIGRLTNPTPPPNRGRR